MSKKTEILELRLSPELKGALARAAQGRGHTMSEMVRHLIEGDLAGSHDPNPAGGSTMSVLSRFRPPVRLMRGVLMALPVLALAGLYLVSPQGSAHASEEARIFFAELDGDGDGAITRPELAAFAAVDGWQPDPGCVSGRAPDGEPCTLEAAIDWHFARADADGNGQVVYAEVEALVLRDRAEDFLARDLDGNGMLSVDEVVGAELSRALQSPEAGTDPEILALPAACVTQFEAEQLPGLAAACGFEAEGRAELAVYDADRNGMVTLLEYLAH
jgi:hypothetical protein